jgi:hypothetical protein
LYLYTSNTKTVTKPKPQLLAEMLEITLDTQYADFDYMSVGDEEEKTLVR